MGISARRHAATFGATIAAAALLLVAAPPAAHAADLVDLPGGATRAITSTTESVTFPLTVLGDIPPIVIDATVVDIVHDNAAQSTDSVTASVDLTARMLTLTITDPDAFTAQGDYDVTLLLTAPPLPETTAPLTESLNVKLTRSAATLAQGGTIEVTTYDRPLGDWPPMWLLNPPDVEPPLTVAVGGDGELLSLSAMQKERAAGAVTLAIPCDDTTCPLAAGSPVALPEPLEPEGVLALDYDLTDFPLGTTTRQVELRSPQIEGAVTLTFEVTRALSPSVIPFIVVLGLLLGWLVRTALPHLIAWAQRGRRRRALLHIADNVGRLYLGRDYDPDVLRLDSPDPDLAQALYNVTSVLRNRGIPNDVIDLQQVQLINALETANAGLEDARKATAVHGDAIQGVWMLPPAVDAEFTAARDAVTQALTAVQERNLRGAQDANRAADAAMVELGDASRAWITQYSDAVEDLADRAAGAPDATGLTDLHDELVTASAAPEAPPADGRPALEAVSRRMKDWLDVRPRLLEVADGLAKYDWADAGDLRTAWLQADPVDALRDGDDSLANLLAEASKPSPVGPLELDEAEADAGAGEAEPDKSQEAEAPAESRGSDLSTLLAVPGASLNFSPSHAVFTGIGWAATLVRYVILAVIASLVALLVAQGTWTGTPDQILIVFAWAFALDLAADLVKGGFTAPDKLPKLTSAKPPTEPTP